MGFRSPTPRKPCPFCGSGDIYAGTILTELDGTEVVLGEVRCQNCEVAYRDYWDERRGDKYEMKKLERLVAQWNRREGEKS